MSSTGRYLCYIKVLGFGELLKDGLGYQPVAVAEAALRTHQRWNVLHRVFKLVAPGDRIILHQEPEGYHAWAFLDIISLAALLHTALLAEGIPSRCVITFGEFTLRHNAEGKHVVLYGEALAEAERAQRHEKWLGITVLPSGVRPYATAEPRAIDMHQQRSRWLMRRDGHLAINPFRNLIRNWEQDASGNRPLRHKDWDAPEYPAELRAFRHLHSETARHSRAGDFSSAIAVKYHSTRSWLQHLLPAACYEWATRVSREV